MGMFLETYKKSSVVNFLLVIAFCFSTNILEDSLLINLFSGIVLLVTYFLIKYSRAFILREIRKHIKLTYRIQNKYLNRYYFIFLNIINLKVKYLKKLSKKYFSIKSNKLIIFSHLKFKFFFFKLIFFKIYILNVVNRLILNISLLTVF